MYNERDGEIGDARKELEYQYSPSKWSKRLDSEKVIQAHVMLCTTGEKISKHGLRWAKPLHSMLEALTEWDVWPAESLFILKSTVLQYSYSISIFSASQKSRECFPYETLRYGEGENQILDIFGTSLAKDSPMLVYVHGGYWQELERSISAYAVGPLVKCGIRVAVVGYDLAPYVKLARIVEEMKELDAFLTSWSAKNGVKRIWYAGHSAGAYLIGTILKNRERNTKIENLIDGMIFISGIYNILPLVDTYVNVKLKLTWDEAQNLSLTYINLKSCPKIKCLVVVAENDSHEFIKQSRQFYEMLLQENPDSEYLMIKEKDHFDVVEKLIDDQYELTQKIIDMILEK